jgi:hypothetical protein
MYAAVATLQMAARQLQLGGGLDPSKYGRIVTQLREVTDQLTAVHRRAGNQKTDPVNFTEMLREAMATASPGSNGIAMPVLEDVMVEGPANDLRDLLSSLFEYALTVGRDPIDLRTQVRQTGPQLRPVYATELVIQSPDVPDFLRRKLWDAVRVRRGEVCVISEPERCRVEFALPIERRSAAQS